MLKVKVCGLANQENIAAIAALQPDYMGFVFYEHSPRYAGELCPDTIRFLPYGIRKVGVFVDAPLHELVDIVQRFDLYGVQLHGSESIEYVMALRALLRTHTISKALRIGRQFPTELVRYYKRYVNSFLFDTLGQQPGGNGAKFNWSTLALYDADLPYTISGGIGRNDVQALAVLKQSAVGQHFYVADINSQFEHAPGVKDVDAVGDFMAAIGRIGKGEAL